MQLAARLAVTTHLQLNTHRLVADLVADPGSSPGVQQVRNKSVCDLVADFLVHNQHFAAILTCR